MTSSVDEGKAVDVVYLDFSKVFDAVFQQPSGETVSICLGWMCCSLGEKTGLKGGCEQRSIGWYIDINMMAVNPYCDSRYMLEIWNKKHALGRKYSIPVMLNTCRYICVSVHKLVYVIFVLPCFLTAASPQLVSWGKTTAPRCWKRVCKAWGWSWGSCIALGLPTHTGWEMCDGAVQAEWSFMSSCSVTGIFCLLVSFSFRRKVPCVLC